MKNKFLIIIGIILLIFSFSFSIAEDGCYVALDFNITEIVQTDNYLDLNFSFVKLDNLYGDYSFLVDNTSETENYSYYLRAYSAVNNYNYSFDPYNSFIQNPGSNLSIIIPFFENINLIKLYSSGEEIYSFSPTGISCTRDCLLVNEFNSSGRCCSGLTKNFISDYNFTCTTCGDGICGDFEDYYSCSFDCSRNISYNCSEGFVLGSYGCVESNVCGNEVVEEGEDCDDGNLIEGDGCSFCKIGGCFDSDVLDSSNGIFNFSFVRFDSNFTYDSCQDTMTLIENVCSNRLKINLAFPFFHIVNEPSSFVQSCSYGCSEGRCLRTEEFQCTIDSDCGANMRCVDNACVPTGGTSDLPPEPILPSGRVS